MLKPFSCVLRKHLFFQRRTFNEKTLNNIYVYLNQYKENISCYQNESGFVRIPLPSWIYSPNGNQIALNDSFKLRLNFWSPNVTCYLKESIHDHPHFFNSFVINGGYEHSVYKQLAVEDKPHNSFATFNFTLDKKNNSIVYNKVVLLEPTGSQSTSIGNIMEFDDRVIHRIDTYKPEALTLNKVDISFGKGNTNLFLSQHQAALVKTARSSLSRDQTEQIIERISQLVKRC